MDEKMVDAEEAIGKALEVARKANLPVLFTTAVSATKKDGTWEVIIEWLGTGKRYKAVIDANTGECLSWSLIK